MGLEKYKAIMVMTGIQFLYAGTTVTVKAALLEEMSSPVFVVYRQCIAFFIMAPFAFFNFSRTGSTAASLTWKTFCSIFLLSFIGVTANQNSAYMGLSLVSSSVISAMLNLAPATTFLMAYALGLEKINIRSYGSIAKIVGTIVCVSGAAAMTLLKGPKFVIMETNQESYDYTWFTGCLLGFASSSCWSIALILQVHTNKIYPDLISLTTWMCLMGAFQCGIFAFIMEPNLNAWKLTSPLQILSCLYAGMVTAVAVLSQSWCVARRGPLFSSMFQPLSTLIVTLLASIILHEDLYVGSMIGGVGVITGLYIVVWGKSEDYKEVKEETPKLLDSQVSHSCTINLEHPLLTKDGN